MGLWRYIMQFWNVLILFVLNKSRPSLGDCCLYLFATKDCFQNLSWAQFSVWILFETGRLELHLASSLHTWLIIVANYLLPVRVSQCNRVVGTHQIPAGFSARDCGIRATQLLCTKQTSLLIRKFLDLHVMWLRKKLAFVDEESWIYSWH